MATYLEELHELFPNGLQSSLPYKERDDVNLLIPLFDDFEVEDKKSSQASEGSSSEALALVDSILFQIDPSLVSKAKEATGESAKVSTEQEACDTALATAKTGTASPPSASVVHEEEVIDQDKSVRRSSSQHISLISRSSSQELQGLAGKAIVRKYDVYTTDETSRSLKRVSNPILVARPTLSSTSKTKVSSGSSPPSPNSALSTSAEASPTQTRFLNIAGRSLRDKATAARVEQSKVSNANDPRKLSERQNGRPSIFNKTSIRPSVPPPTRRNHASSESEGSPPTNRNATYRTRSTIPSSRSPSHSHYRASVTGGSVRRSPGKATELPKIHKWDLDETEKPPKFIQGRYISSGEIVDPLASMRKADFTGYQNGWKPIESRSVGGRQSDGYVLGGGSFDRRDRFTHEDQGDGEEEDSNPTPLHWRGDVDSEKSGKRRFTGKGALGSRPGTFKNRSDERFAAATAALEREQEREYTNQAPDPLEGMHPAAASWEMQRRGILLRSDRRARSAQAA